MSAKKKQSKTPPAKAGKPSAKNKVAKPSAADASSRLSALDAAARVLGEKGEPLTCGQLIESMAAQGYWTSPGGKTPAATLSAALHREIRVKQAQARFRKAERGMFALA